MSDARLNEQAAFRLKALVMARARISWEVPHARQRAIERGVPTFIAERIVRAVGSVRVTYTEDGTESWRVSGHDPDGRPVDVVVVPAPKNTIRVITVIRTDVK